MPTDCSLRITTAEELFELPSDGLRYELIKGRLLMMSPAGGRHGRLAIRIALLLGNHVDAHRLGVVLAAETGFRLSVDPDTVLAADVAYVERRRYAGVANESHYLPLAPDLAVEVLSPSDRFARVEAKVLTWLDAGCRLVLVVDPESAAVHAYWSQQRIKIYQQHESIDCSEVVPQWILHVGEIFRPY
jgi:Uma2 family endonuclease